MGSGRLGPTVAALLGLGGSVIGARALLRRRAGAGAEGPPTASPLRDRPAIAVVLGAVSLVLGVLFVATADGGPGTGNGVVASVGAMVFGPLAIGLGELARRSGVRRVVRPRA